MKINSAKNKRTGSKKSICNFRMKKIRKNNSKKKTLKSIGKTINWKKYYLAYK